MIDKSKLLSSLGLKDTNEGYDYFRVGDIEISPDDKVMAYSIDTLSTLFFGK